MSESTLTQQEEAFGLKLWTITHITGWKTTRTFAGESSPDVEEIYELTTEEGVWILVGEVNGDVMFQRQGDTLRRGSRAATLFAWARATWIQVSGGPVVDVDGELPDFPEATAEPPPAFASTVAGDTDEPRMNLLSK